MSKWALYKAFQRLKYSHEKQHVREAQKSEMKEKVETARQKGSGVKQLFQAIGVITTILIIYFVYIAIKNNREINSSET